MLIDWSQHPALLAWANDQLKVEFEPKQCSWVGVADDNRSRIRAVIVFSRWSTHNVELSIASDGSKDWFSRRLARQVFGYVFDTAKRARLSTVADMDVPEALAMNDRLFQREGRLKDWFGEGHDGMLYGLTAAEWRASKWR